MPIKLQLAPPDLQTFLRPWSLNWNLYDARIARDFCPVTKSGINYELIAIGSRWVLRVGFNVDALKKIHAQNFNTTTWSFRVTLSKKNCTKRIVFLAPNYVWTFNMFYLDSRTICHEQDCLTFSSSKYQNLTHWPTMYDLNNLKRSNRKLF